jgi:hypothetical protein
MIQKTFFVRNCCLLWSWSWCLLQVFIVASDAFVTLQDVKSSIFYSSPRPNCRIHHRHHHPFDIRFIVEHDDKQLSSWGRKNAVCLEAKSNPTEEKQQHQISEAETTTTTTTTTITKGGGDLNQKKAERYQRVTLSDKKWLQQYENLKAYKGEHGHCNVDTREDGLVGWVERQRTTFRGNKLRKDRKELLDEIGFDCEPGNTFWLQQYENLKAYKDEHGHCNVNTKEDGLGNWVHTQRTLFRGNKLRKDRKELLDTIGLIWMPYDEVWRDTFDQLKEFKETNGHIDVPLTRTNLHGWIYKQRLLHDAGRLDSEQKAKLDDVGFVWEDPDKERRDRQWNEKFLQLVSFMRVNGHCKVPIKGSSLGQWVGTQRRCCRDGRILDDRKVKLDSIEFIWQVRPASSQHVQSELDKRWLEMYEELQAFQKEHGHCNVMTREKGLGRWVDKQRVMFRQEKLRQERVELLEKIDFVWEPNIISRDLRWRAKYVELESFLEEFGHTNVPSRTPLYDWIKQQHVRNEAGRLEPERKAVLDSLGMEW